MDAVVQEEISGCGIAACAALAGIGYGASKARAEKLVIPRFWLFESRFAERLIGILALILAIVVFLPIPLGNWPPAFALAVLGFAHSQRDGLGVLAGCVIGILSLMIAGFGVMSILPMALAWLIVRRRSTPIVAEQFHTPATSPIDARLIGGAALFGIGWGLVGLCPGPAIAALAIQPAPALLFIAAMALGAAIHCFALTPRRSA